MMSLCVLSTNKMNMLHHQEMAEDYAIKWSSAIIIIFPESNTLLDGECTPGNLAIRYRFILSNKGRTGECGKGQSLCDTVQTSQSKQLQNHSLPVDCDCCILFF